MLPQFFGQMRCKRGEHDQESTQGLLTHGLLGVLRLQHKVQELHHRTDGRIKAKTFEALRHLLEHNVQLLLNGRSSDHTSLRHPIQDPVPSPPQKTVDAFNAVIVPLGFLFRWANKQLVQTYRIRAVLHHQIVRVHHIAL